MTGIDEATLRLVVLCLFGSNCLLLFSTSLALLIFIYRAKAPVDREKTLTGTGTFCGHCSQRLGLEPTRAIALGNKNYFVYKCGGCGNETLLPASA